MVCASNILFVKSVSMTRIILEVSSDDVMILGMVNMVIQAHILTVTYVSKQQPNTFLRVRNVLEVAQSRCGVDRDFQFGLGHFLKHILLSTHLGYFLIVFFLPLGKDFFLDKLSMNYERIIEGPVLLKLEKIHFLDLHSCTWFSLWWSRSFLDKSHESNFHWKVPLIGHGSRERKAKGAVGNANRLWCSFMYIEDLKLRCVIIISNQLGVRTVCTFFLSQSSISSLIQFVCFSLLTNWPRLAKKKSCLRPRKQVGWVKW